MKSAFTCGQHPHQKEKAINSVINLWDEMKQDDFVREFEDCIRLLCYQDFRSKYTRDCLSFVVDCAVRLNQEFSQGTKKFVAKVEFLEYLCGRISLWKRSYSMDFRFNSSHLLGLLSENMEELDDILVRKLSKLFQDYFTDIKHPIRYVAASHLFKFQHAENPKDPANISYRFHALKDSNAQVRLRCAQRMCLKLPYDDVIIRLTRDCDERVRATAFKRAAMSFEFRSLPDNERSKLIKSISAEKNEKVLAVVKEQLITKLIEAFEYDVSALLGSFGYPDEKKDAEHFIDLALESLLESEKKSSGQMERFVKKFSKNFLNSQRLMRNDTISFQSIISWHKLIRFVQKNEDILEPQDEGQQYDLESKGLSDGSILSSQEQVGGQYSSQTTKSSLKSTRTPLVYYLLPEFPHFCGFITNFVESVEDCGRENEAPLVLENLVFEEFISMIDCFDLFDSAHKNALLNTLNRFIHFEALVYYFPDYISTIVKCLSTHLFTCSRDSLIFIARAREFLMNEGIPEPESINNISSVPMEEEDGDQYSRVIDKIGDLRERLEAALDANDLENADSITKEIRELDRKKKELMTRKSTISVDGSGFRSSDTEDDDDALPKTELKDVSLIKIIELLRACLWHNDFKTIDHLMKSYLDFVVVNGFSSKDPKIRARVMQCLGLVSFVSVELARKYSYLIFAAITYDKFPIQLEAIKSFFDIICEHGLSLGYTDPPKNETPSKDTSTEGETTLTPDAMDSEEEKDTSSRTLVGNTGTQESNHDSTLLEESSDEQSEREIMIDRVRDIFQQLLKMKKSDETEPELVRTIDLGLAKVRYIKAKQENKPEVAERILQKHYEDKIAQLRERNETNNINKRKLSTFLNDTSSYDS